jgi:hypothetical protein
MTETVPATVDLSDPRAMRALAHPVRLALLELVHSEGSTNATESAAATGESPQACSYHLRTLARWGFVRHVETADGRETRWGPAARGFRFRHDGDTPEADAAASLLQNRLTERDDRALSTYLEREREVPAEWRDAAQFISGTVHVTLEELQDIEAQLHDLVQRYRREKDERPEGSRRVRVVFRAFPHMQPRGRRTKR